VTELPIGTVTFLFTDIEGSTRLLGKHPREYAKALLRHDALMQAAVEAEGGVVFETIGDAVYAVFGSPVAAVRAALRAQIDLHAEQWGDVGELRVRMAVHGGDVERRRSHYFGAPLYRCARLMAIGHGGQVLLSGYIAQAVRGALPPDAELREMGFHRLKDLADPEEVFQLTHPDLLADFAPLRSLDPRATNLPLQANTFVGREHERSIVRKLLASSKVVTLTGAGGVGKTRLAQQVASEVIADFDDGVWFVTLAAVSHSAFVLGAIAETLRIVERPRELLPEALERHLKTKELLLVLDNFEQVMDAAPLVANFISTCRNVKILVTSRVPLHITSEQQFAVPPLGVAPDKQSDRADPATRSDAVALFIQRALAVRPDLSLDDSSLDTIRDICTRLDGLPLAIELAAARSKVLPPKALLARLDRRLPLLNGGAADLPVRQQSMRAAIEWSYELLGAREREVFERLSVFSGGCTLDAAESVWGSGGAIGVLDTTSALIDASLLGQEVQPDGEPRLTMLETIREFGLERLTERGRLGSVRAAHGMHYLAFADVARPALRGPENADWYRRVSAEHANLTGALEWFVSQRNGEPALRMCADLCHFWVARGLQSEGRSWVERALALGDGASNFIRAEGFSAAGEIALLQGDAGQARAWKEEALRLFRSCGDRPWTAATLSDLGNVALLEGDAARGMSLYEESLALRREIGVPMGIVHALAGVAAASRYQWDHARAAVLLDEALALAPYGDLELHCRFNLGMLALEQGDHERASVILQKTLSQWYALGDVMYTAACLAGLAGVETARGAAERAARLLGLVEAVLEPAGAVFWAEDEKTYRRTLDATRRQLDATVFTSAWREGRSMSVERAISGAEARPAATAGEGSDGHAPGVERGKTVARQFWS
jgi:predicted ATPase/class 3 adenylate cyclase